MSATLAYGGYLLWLLAGCLDFACRRRTQLPQTSGLRESAFHLAQLALLGVAMTPRRSCVQIVPSVKRLSVVHPRR